MNVEYSRWAVKMLQRWGYDVRYHELPGRGHEDMKVQPGIWEWLLQHRREAHPRRVRVRAADLQLPAPTGCASRAPSDRWTSSWRTPR